MTYFDIMTDTMNMCNAHSLLNASIWHSVCNQVLFSDERVVPPRYRQCAPVLTKYIVSGERSFEAAKKYSGFQVAVLNFANCRSIGGNPYYANAQEECLCRCSTLLPCLQAMKSEYYERHLQWLQTGEMDYMGNDDIIYTPVVTVFKTDENFPKLMPEPEWYQVNVITCAAPELWQHAVPANYEEVITRRLRKVLDIAAAYQNRVLILGAWGCGAFMNPPEVVARFFKKLLQEYQFQTIEFAMGSSRSDNYNVFMDAFAI